MVQTLVLGADNRPINMYRDYERALTKVYAGRAVVVSEYENVHLRSWKTAINAQP